MITLCSSSPKTYEPKNLLSGKENGTSLDVAVSMVRKMARLDPSMSTYSKQMIGQFSRATNKAASKHEPSFCCLGVAPKVVSGQFHSPFTKTMKIYRDIQPALVIKEPSYRHRRLQIRCTCSRAGFIHNGKYMPCSPNSHVTNRLHECS